MLHLIYAPQLLPYYISNAEMYIPQGNCFPKGLHENVLTPLLPLNLLEQQQHQQQKVDGMNSKI